jgi:hypothetical protein
LEIKMPEHKAGRILEAEAARLERNDPEQLQAWFILSNHPQRRFRGRVERIATTAEFDEEQKQQIVLVRVVPEDVADFIPDFVDLERHPGKKRLSSIHMKLKDGREFKMNPEAEVTAKVDCGKRSLGYVLLRELIEFVYETIVF